MDKNDQGWWGAFWTWMFRVEATAAFITLFVPGLLAGVGAVIAAYFQAPDLAVLSLLVLALLLLLPWGLWIVFRSFGLSLTVDLLQVAVGENAKGETVGTLVAAIRNTGTRPSVGRSMSMTIVAGKEVYKGQLFALPKELVLGQDGDGPTYSLAGKDALYEKANNPIPVGGIVTGVICAKFDVPREVLVHAIEERSGITILLHCCDIRGKQYEAEHVLHGPSLRMLHKTPGFDIAIKQQGGHSKTPMQPDLNTPDSQPEQSKP